MKSFMSAALQDTQPARSATECTACDGGAVRTAGQESVEPAAQKPADQTKQELSTPGENAVVVMQGPLGTAITEALNRSLSKKISVAPVQLPAAATEGLTEQYVQANGQINNAPALLSKISKAVGLVPCTDVAPTAINTLLDCAAKVDDIEFIMVNKVDDDPSPSVVPQKSVVEIMQPGSSTGEQVAIESIQVVVSYRKVKR